MESPNLENLENPSNQQEALKVLVRYIEIAQSRGAYNLYESSHIVKALSLFQNNEKKNSKTPSNP